ncbi:hypothetical protein ABQE93_17355 [Mycolicibacterium sp. XJ662]
MAVGLVVSACTGSEAGEQASDNTSKANNADLPSLIPTPAGSQQTNGPDDIADNGIHMHFRVDGAPVEVMDAYKAALEGEGWSVTTIVTSGGEGGGGATYTGTHGDVFGVIDGGGYDRTTFVDVCAWPSKPAEPNCSRGER